MIKGTVHKFGANIDTDGIIPARYLKVTDPDLVAAHCAKYCMEEVDPGFVKRVKPGDVMVATSNFGCGSSRDQAAFAIKGSGISCVIAQSYGRIFFRNAINVGLPLLECEESLDDIKGGDTLEVDLATGKIHDVTSGRSYQAKRLPDFILELVAAGGIIEYTRRKLGTARPVIS